MQPTEKLKKETGDIDIYLLDQILKGRYRSKDKILDAGCGNGRNMYWFLKNNFNITGIDIDETAIIELKKNNPQLTADRLLISPVEKTIFPDNTFDHIICSAVLHFARSTNHFNGMMAEMTRILRPGGSLFIRMATDIGIESLVQPIADGVYLIPDGSKRFLLTRPLIASSLQQNNLSLAEPLKTVNVDDVRCMSTLMLQKNFSV